MILSFFMTPIRRYYKCTISFHVIYSLRFNKYLYNGIVVSNLTCHCNPSQYVFLVFLFFLCLLCATNSIQTYMLQFFHLILHTIQNVSTSLHCNSYKMKCNLKSHAHLLPHHIIKIIKKLN